MAEPVAFKVLEELGMLVRSGRVLPDAPGPAPGPSAAHALSGHVPAWEYENPVFAHPFENPGIPLYETLKPTLSPGQVLDRTRLAVFVGAAESQAFRLVMGRKDSVVLVFEPEAGRLARLAGRAKPRDLAGRNLFFFLGEPAAFHPPLAELLPADIFMAGFPVFYLREDLAETRPDYVREVIEQIEFLFFRYRIYPVSGQFNVRGLPLRDIARGLFFDQQKHAYENAAPSVRQGNLQQLAGAFKGRTALLVAAGPDLERRIEYLREGLSKAVVIAVNNALKPLLAHGIEPHFVVVNDTSQAIEQSFAGLAPLSSAVLVGHCLSHLGGGLFPRAFLFNNYRPEVFGARPTLKLYGSVITTAFALARFLGCRTCVLVGVQLASEDPWSLNYARGSIHGRGAAQDLPLTNRFPQLYPVTNRFGLTLYTSLNFRDACLWFLDEIRGSKVRCVNLCRESILHGDGVEYAEDFPLPAEPGLDTALARVRAMPPALTSEPGKVRAWLGRELSAWRNTAGPIEALLARPSEGFVPVALDVLRQLDAGNVSYLVQRFQDFDHRRFHALVFESRDEAARERGLRYCLGYVLEMARFFVGLIEGQLRELQA